MSWFHNSLRYSSRQNCFPPASFPMFADIPQQRLGTRQAADKVGAVQTLFWSCSVCLKLLKQVPQHRERKRMIMKFHDLDDDIIWYSNIFYSKCWRKSCSRCSRLCPVCFVFPHALARVLWQLYMIHMIQDISINMHEESSGHLCARLCKYLGI